MKLACVVHRFGADIAGGSEGHCRLIAEHLSARHDVTILTTCAKDHITWAFQNTDFIQSLNSKEKAVAYVNEHFPD